MPLYEYQCMTCGSRLERRQRFDEDPLRDCPGCGGRLNRLLQPAGIIFKGSGWYCTDSRPKSSESTDSSSSKSTSDSSTSPTSNKGESKLASATA
ncbi:MAG TPA: FmdB family zinc ribbon protein [Chloroflexota bacterium]|nr:FmdB family zinc ribbon protein [Chloroflexota bacterium]